jgi:hypothetical protein
MGYSGTCGKLIHEKSEVKNLVARSLEKLCGATVGLPKS